MANLQPRPHRHAARSFPRRRGHDRGGLQQLHQAAAGGQEQHQTRLDTLHTPAESSAQGLQLPSYYSWGGHAALDKKSGKYQGFFSFMCKHKTLFLFKVDTLRGFFSCSAKMEVNIVGTPYSDVHLYFSMASKEMAGSNVALG